MRATVALLLKIPVLGGHSKNVGGRSKSVGGRSKSMGGRSKSPKVLARGLPHSAPRLPEVFISFCIGRPLDAKQTAENII